MAKTIEPTMTRTPPTPGVIFLVTSIGGHSTCSLQILREYLASLFLWRELSCHKAIP